MNDIDNHIRFPTKINEVYFTGHFDFGQRLFFERILRKKPVDEKIGKAIG